MKRVLIDWVVQLSLRWRSFRLRLRFVYYNLKVTRGNSRLIAEKTSNEPTLRHLKTWQDLLQFLFVSDEERRRIRLTMVDEAHHLWLAEKLCQEKIEA
ncbi:MAG: hypothetical protein ABH826_02610 [Patescibacteria group bacterium]|nr:hypothetical protein [Patescibacteria group bacterium]